jgi:hypothetical protein
MDVIYCELKVTDRVGEILERTWKRVKPPNKPDPVAVTSSGTKRSCSKADTGHFISMVAQR